MNKKGKKKQNKQAQVKVRQTKSKSSGRNVMIEEEEEEVQQVQQPLVPYKTMHDKRVNLKNMSINMLAYMSEFLGIEDMAQLTKVNRRTKSIIKKNKMFTKFFKIRSFLQKQMIISETEIFTQKSVYFNTIYTELGKDLTPSELEHLMQELICSLKIGSQLTTSNFDNETALKNLGMILKSNKSPYDSITINSTNFLPEFIELVTPYLTKSSKLTKLTIGGNQLSVMDSAFIEAISKSKSLKELTVCECYSSNLQNYLKNLEQLFTSIEKSKSITKLVLYVADAGGKLGNLIAKNKTIKTLVFGKDFLNYQFLRSNNTIETLEFLSHALKAKSLKNLSQSLDKSVMFKKKLISNSSIVSNLIIGGSYITNYKHITLITTMISNNPSITSLDINGSNLKDILLGSLFELLKTNTTIRKLSLVKNKIDYVGFFLLMDMLRFNRTLEEVNLSDNEVRVSEQNLQGIADILNNNDTLKSLNVGTYHTSLTHKVEEVLVLKEIRKLTQILN